MLVKMQLSRPVKAKPEQATRVLKGTVLKEPFSKKRTVP